MVDGGWLFHRARWSWGKSWNPDDFAGLMFSVLDHLRSLCFDPRCQSGRLCLFFDSGVSFRHRVFPGYKANRRSMTKEDAINSVALRSHLEYSLKTIFPKIGISTYQKTGLEADDLIAAACLSLPPSTRAIIITSDNDLYQCISNNVHWYDPTRLRYLTSETFKSYKGVRSDQWVQVKELSGCSSDGISGVGGVGEVTAIDYICGRLLPNSKRYMRIQSADGREIIARNRELVSLPHKLTGVVVPREPHYNWDGFKSLCFQYGWESFVDFSSARGRSWRVLCAGRASLIDSHLRHSRRRGE